MRRWAGIIGGLMLVACAMGAAGRPVSAATYADPDGRFTFLAPQGYTQRYRAGTDISYRSLTAATITFDVTVVAQSPEPLPTPDAFVTNVLMSLKPPTYVDVSTPEPVMLGGQPGRRFDYSTVLEGSATRLHTLEIVAVSSRLVVVLVFSAPETEYPQMVNDTTNVLLGFSFSRTPGVVGSSTADGSVTASSVTAGGVTVSPFPPTPTPPAPTRAASATAGPADAGGPVAPTFPPPPATTAPLLAPTAAFLPGPLPGAAVVSGAPTVGVRRLGEG